MYVYVSMLFLYWGTTCCLFMYKFYLHGEALILSVFHNIIEQMLYSLNQGHVKYVSLCANTKTWIKNTSNVYISDITCQMFMFCTFCF